MKIERGPDPGPFSAPRQYISHLRILFGGRCAYCRTHDNFLGGEEAVEVEHFRPEDRYPELRLAWKNLYYSCRTCNNRKGNHPDAQEEADGSRFVDPCAEDPHDHFLMIRDRRHRAFCRIRPLSDAAEYTIRRLQLNDRKFLCDHWREIDATEKRLARDRDDLGMLLLALDMHENERGRVQSMMMRIETQLAEIRDRRPFPLDPG